MPLFLEVIVTSVAEAIAAERGGADRLELVRDLDQGGLTPPATLVKEVTSAVSVPIRVMIRETASMSVSDSSELARLKASIDECSGYSIDGVVLGLVRDRCIDTRSLDELLTSDRKVTFHRAFDEVQDPISAIATLKRYPQIDRILSCAGEGSWSSRKARLDQWQSLAAPTIQMLFAVGSETSHLGELCESPTRYEVHVGRAARIDHRYSGPVSAEYVAALKNIRGYASARDQTS